MTEDQKRIRLVVVLAALAAAMGAAVVFGGK